jgi:hypothetical protein
MTEALNGQPDSWFAVPDGLHAVNVNGYTAYLLPGTEPVAQTQQPPPGPAGCDEDCGGGGGGGQGQGRHRKHG